MCKEALNSAKTYGSAYYSPLTRRGPALVQALLLLVLVFASTVQGRTINILRQPEQARACSFARMRGPPGCCVPSLRTMRIF